MLAALPDGQALPAAKLAEFHGVPPAYLAKHYLLKSAMEPHDQQPLRLVVAAVVNSAISIYYYLRIVTAMYFREATTPFTPTRSPGLVFVLAVCPLVVLELGLMPGWWLKLIG